MAEKTKTEKIQATETHADGFLDEDGHEISFTFSPGVDSGAEERRRDEVAACLDTLGGVLEPLDMEMFVLCRDDDWGDTEDAPEPCWRLCADPLPEWAVAEPQCARPVTWRRPHLSPESVAEWVAEGTHQECPRPGLTVTTWQSIFCYVTQARLPDTLAGRQTLTLDSRWGRITIPVIRDMAGDAWVGGSRQSSNWGPPFSLRLEQEWGDLALRLTIYWSLWTEPGAPGTEAVRAAVARLLERGWQAQNADSPLMPERREGMDKD